MADRRVGKRLMNQRSFSKVESGTCNVCAAPCSSCMHRDVGFTGSKSGESSDENGHGVAGSQCSVNEDGTLPSSVINARNSSNNTVSEASNLVSSSHDALCENAESKEIKRSSGISDGSRAVGMTSKTYISKGRMRKKTSASSANVLDQSSNSVQGQEEGILSDDSTKIINSGYPNDKILNKDSALVSDLILGGSRKDQDSTMVESSSVPNEVKSESLHNSSSNHEDKMSSERGILKEKLGQGGNKEIEEASAKGSTVSGQNGKDGKSSKSTSANKSDEPVSSHMSESESDDSEMVEHDVKVCDICGDAGREDLLAICSGCSDGAEHTYCMRERLDAVPEGDWLCEECEEAEKQKQVAKKEETAVTLNTNNLGKRHADKTEAAPDAKRQAIEGSTGSPKKSILPKIGALSRETSFKGLDKSRGKLSHQASFSDNSESGRSTGSQLQPPKGAFLKSSSFNCSSSKQKVQLMDDTVPSRQKTGKEYTSLDIKEGGFKGKSISSRTIDAGNSIGNDSQAKTPGSKIYPSKEGKSSKQLNNRSTEANASASSIDQKLISRCNSSASYANNTRDLKGLQSDGKRGSLTKQVSNLNRNRLERPVASGGDESCSGSEHSSGQADCKEELPSTCEGEAVPSHGIVASQDGLSRSREFREVGKKSKESFGKRQRSSMLSGAKGLPSSQKGGQTAQSGDISAVSDSDLTTTKNVREDINKGNRLRAAVDAALRKKPSFGKNRALEQEADVPLVPNVDSHSDKTLRNQLPSKMQKNYASHEGLQGGHSTLWPASDPSKKTFITNEKQHAFSGADAMPLRSVEPENHPSVRPVMRDWPLISPPDLLRSSAIPDHKSIWQGDLEVQKPWNHSAMHSGMQAHLSTLASPKVAEVANKFPEKFSLYEVPRLSTWPSQFQDIGTQEDHIALFFFAKDCESYERNYKPLVDNMIKKDLALKGNFNNVELLIFPSNQLPLSCQRWNMFYFLWGVFRGRKEICSNPQKNTFLPASNVLPCDKDPSYLCQTSSTSKHPEKASSLRESLHNKIETRNRTDVLSHDNPSDRGSSIERLSSIKEEIAIKDPERGVNHIPCQAAGLNSGDSIAKKVEKIGEHESGGMKDLPLTVTASETQSRDQDNPIARDLNCGQENHRKRPLWDLTRPTIDNSFAMSQKVELSSDGLCEGSANKKLKTENQSSSSVSRDTYGNNDSGIMKKSPKVVFPLDLNEETTEDGMGLLPFLGGTSNSCEQSSNSMNKEKQKEDEDDDAALSLSLSFPTEEPKNVDTPLFLFRDLPR